MRHLTRRYRHLIAPVRRGGGWVGGAVVTTASTRSWRASTSEPKWQAMDDLVLAGLSTTMSVALQRSARRLLTLRFARIERACPLVASTFGRAIFTRSVCLHTVWRGVAQCPHFGDVFVRDFAHVWALARPLPLHVSNVSRSSLRLEELILPEAPAVELRFRMLRERGMPRLVRPCVNVSYASCFRSWTAALN